MSINKNDLITAFIKAKEEKRFEDIREFFKWYRKAYGTEELMKYLVLNEWNVATERHAKNGNQK